jgi:hypothetical protein
MRLGISHVHLLPTFDYANGDETQAVDGYTWYNWGYDPVLYNTPEGSYASAPDDHCLWDKLLLSSTCGLFRGFPGTRWPMCSTTTPTETSGKTFS